MSEAILTDFSTIAEEPKAPYPLAEVPLYANHPLPAGTESIDLARERNYVMVNDRVTMLTASENWILEYLMQHRDGEVPYAEIVVAGSRDDQVWAQSLRTSAVIKDLLAKVNTSEQELIQYREPGVKFTHNIFRINEAVTVTGTITESNHTPAPYEDYKIQDSLWYRKGHCRGVDVNTFVPEHGASENIAKRRYCQRCPVKADCLADAILLNDEYGVRGDMTASERESLAKARRAALDAQEVWLGRRTTETMAEVVPLLAESA